MSDNDALVRIVGVLALVVMFAIYAYVSLIIWGCI